MQEELKVVITADTSGLEDGVDKSKEKVKKFGKESKDNMKAFDEAMDSAKQACKTAMTAIAGAITGAVTAMTALAESTRELRTNQAKLTTAFESAGASAEVATKVYDDLFRVLGDDGQTTEAANHLAKLTTNEQDLAEWTEICKGVYAEFGDSLPIEGLTEAANETAKVGQVTGSLADALNWAGVSEDEFNEKLANCNDEAEREKLIRTTLNKLYKTSASNYENNNKSVLKANEAQNKLNKTLAKTGEAVEPVNAELKELGATLLEDAQKPIKEVTRWLTGSFFPGLKQVYGWLKSNLPAVSGIVVGLTTAYVGYQAAVVSAKLAEEGLTLAIIAKTAAQKALNVVMNANPYVLITGAVVALTAGLVTYNSIAKETIEEAYELTEAEQALREKADEVTESFYQQVDATNQSIASYKAEMDYTKDLVEELGTLVDANGKVKEADEARVNFILGELKKATGEEYELVDGTIQKYSELKDSIYEVIEAKAANAMLESKSEEFVKAKETEKLALQDFLTAQKDVEAEYAALQEAEAVYMQKQQEYDEMKNWLTAAQRLYHLNNLETYKNEYNARLEDYNNSKKTLEDKAKAYKDAQDAINDYQDAAIAIQEGNYAKAIEILQAESGAYFQYSDDVSKATQETVDALFKKAVDAGIAADETKRNFEAGVEGYTAEMVAEAEMGYGAALAEWATAYSDAAGVGGDLGDGIFNGLGGKLPNLVSKARSIITSMIGAMRSAADSHSPSKKTISLGEDMGEGAEIGISDTTKDVVKASKNMINESLKAIEGVSARNFGGAISGSIISAKSTSASSKSIVAPEASTLLASIGSKLTGTTPIILEVDGKVFAQTAVNTMNKRFKQTGKMDLVLV